MSEASPLNKQDFTSEQEVRWCPGCGDYAILSSVQKILPELGIAPENTVFVSGIGCSSRFPYYLNTYGFHTIHGRAPTIATGIKLARPDLSVWIVTGDGDGLSIGTNHLLHLMRRNLDVTILLFNNKIYGLTKGQYSPTSEKGKVTKTTPLGSIDEPFNPIQLALAANCSFVARAIDVDTKNLQAILKAAAQHRGTSFVEILQNCNVFNDGAFDDISQRAHRAERTVMLMPDQPAVFGSEQDKAITFTNNRFELRTDDTEAAYTHRADLSIADAIALNALSSPVPIGIFRAVERACYEADQTAQLTEAKLQKPKADLNALLHSGKTWQID